MASEHVWPLIRQSPSQFYKMDEKCICMCSMIKALWGLKMLTNEIISYLQKYVARKSCTKNQFSLSSWVLRFYWKSVKDVRHSLLLWHDCIVRDVGQVFIGRDTDQLHMLSSRQKDCHRHFYFHLCRIVDDNVNENLVVFCVFCFNFSSFSSCSVTHVLCPRSSSKQIGRSTRR